MFNRHALLGWRPTRPSRGRVSVVERRGYHWLLATRSAQPSRARHSKRVYRNDDRFSTERSQLPWRTTAFHMWNCLRQQLQIVVRDCKSFIINEVNFLSFCFGNVIGILPMPGIMLYVAIRRKWRLILVLRLSLFFFLKNYMYWIS